jgi:hypothetical protein
VQLAAGDEVAASVSAQLAGSGLQAALRAFGPGGGEVGRDAQKGGDPALTFQAPAAGTYYVGVSSQGDTAYDPAVPGSGIGGLTTGLYTLHLALTPGAPLLPDVQGESFRLGQTTATWSGTNPSSVTCSFTVGNRGGANAGPFDVQLVASGDTSFASPVMLQTLHEAGLQAGQFLSVNNLAVPLPILPDAQTRGLPASGPVYLGLRIVPAAGAPGSYDAGGTHRGEDWEQLEVLTPVTADGSNQSAAAAQALDDPNSLVSGTLAAGQQDWYQITVPDMQAGKLSADVTATGGNLNPALTLYAADGKTELIQSNGTAPGDPAASLAEFVQAGSQPGPYYLVVSALSGSGAYQLTSQLAQGASAVTGVPVGSVPIDIAVGDFNGDGRPDAAVVNNHDGTVSILLGNGDGSFETAQTIQVGQGPVAVAAADINGDGHLDLIVVNQDSNTVSVLLGQGDGTFKRQPDIPGFNHPDAVAVGDVTGDGKLDLIVANQGDGTVSVLADYGAGGFESQTSIPVGKDPTTVAVGDVNGDGLRDIIVGRYDGTITILAKGDGTFQPLSAISTGKGLVDVAVGDINGDGTQDLVLTNIYSGTVGVLLGKGDGSFQPQKNFDVGADTLPYRLALADVNGDGKLDIVAINPPSNSVTVLLGNGDGTFQPRRTFAAGSNPEGIAVVDINGDGRPDLLVVDQGTYTLGVLLGNGDGSFQTALSV